MAQRSTQPPRKLYLWIMFILGLGLTSASARTASFSAIDPPFTISYQGSLVDGLNQPVSGATPMVFKLYSGPTSGTPLWTETRSGNNAVAVNQGLFHVLLGSLSPLDVQLATQTLWLGISVNGDAEMTPRSQLGGVHFAQVAANVPNQSISSEKQTIQTLQATDLQAIRIRGAVPSQLLSEFIFEDVPAGDISINATLVGRLEEGLGDGSLSLKVNNALIDYRPSHVITQDFTQVTLIGSVDNFAGGTLTIQMSASTEQTNAQVLYGIDNDPRFQRKVVLTVGQ
ncbi:hypothetical protein [Herpetosiphon gulosus]|uniref:Uncharacterized protein n=1 Tax=Herpetosiphon gulosus TaxID=1973496 RepID=A0ABP9X4F0_9CHLR